MTPPRTPSDTGRPDNPEADAPAPEAREPDAGGGRPGMRINRLLARAGLASRREAERWIAEGRVSVDGRVLAEPGVVVPPGADVRVDGKPVPPIEETRVWRFHKPTGLVTTAADPEGRPTVFDQLPEEMPRVVSIGRLDINSEGLLLLTNDGALARHLELPATGWPRRYRVRAHGAVDEKALEALADGVVVDGVRYGPIEAALDRVQGSNAWLTVGLREGRNREVRRVMEHLGLTVTRLIRVSYGPFHLGNLPPGAVDEVKARVLRDQIPGYFAAGGALTEGEAGAEARRAPPTRGRSTKPAARKQTEGRAGGAARPMTGGRPTPGRTAGPKRAGAPGAPADRGARSGAGSPDDQPAQARRTKGAPAAGAPTVVPRVAPTGSGKRAARAAAWQAGRSAEAAGESAEPRGGDRRTARSAGWKQDRSAGPRASRPGPGRRDQTGSGDGAAARPVRDRHPAAGGPAKAGLGKPRSGSPSVLRPSSGDGTAGGGKVGGGGARAGQRPTRGKASSGPAADGRPPGGKASAGKTGKPASGAPGGGRAGGGRAGGGRAGGGSARGPKSDRDPGRPSGRGGKRPGGGDAGHRRRP